MDKIGIVTYHAAYNFGSVLQAYATQQKLLDLGIDNEIINYRMDEQKRFYSRYRTSFGLISLIKDLSQIGVHAARGKRAERFEAFIDKRFKKTSECRTPEDVYSIWKRYPMIISGSDQIWNKHSHELACNTWDYMMPYVLKDFVGVKISYASSIGDMNREELENILPHIKRFQDISVREYSSQKPLADTMSRPVEWVLDPTFLLDRREWTAKLDLQETDQPYVLYYSLKGPRGLMRNIPVLKQFAKQTDCPVKLITPFAYLPVWDNNIASIPDAGPIEFLQMIKNARHVVTDSYHGTILSVNFHRDVFSICEHGGAHFRKTDILEKLHMEDRIVYDIADIVGNPHAAIDYEEVEKRLAQYRKHSVDYLKNAVNRAWTSINEGTIHGNM